MPASPALAPLPPVTPPRRSPSTRSSAHSNAATPRHILPDTSPSVRPPFKPSLPKTPPPPLGRRSNSSREASLQTATTTPLAQGTRSSWLPTLRSYMPRTTYTSEILPIGPYTAGDIVVFELLDENEVWQWALGKLLCVEPTNERVAQVIPLSPVGRATQFIYDSHNQLPVLSGDALMSARDALRQLAKAKAQHGERGEALKSLLLELHKELTETAEDQRKVQQTLEDVLPALEKARDAVNRISWQDLSEMRSYPTPPPIVKRVLEGVMFLLEDRVPQEAVKWKEVKQHCRGNDFVPRVRDFEGAISVETSKYVVDNFIKDPTFTLQNANKASVAAGPLFEWIEAQVRCCDVIRDLAPTLVKLEAMDKLVKDNEAKTKALRDEQDALFRSLQAETRKYQEVAFGIDFTMPPTTQDGNASGKSGPFVLDRVSATLQQHPVDRWQPTPNTAVKRILYSSIMGKSKAHETPRPPTPAPVTDPPTTSAARSGSASGGAPSGRSRSSVLKGEAAVEESGNKRSRATKPHRGSQPTNV